MDFLILLTVGGLNIVCFSAGVRIGARVARSREGKRETGGISFQNPLKAYRQREARRQVKAEEERVRAILSNIDTYDGTSNGQKDIPGR